MPSATTMQRMRTVLAVAVAGALGALARCGVGAWFGHRFPFAFLPKLDEMAGD